MFTNWKIAVLDEAKLSDQTFKVHRLARLEYDSSKLEPLSFSNIPFYEQM